MTQSIVPGLPVAGARQVCGAVLLDQAYFLRLLARCYPPDWLNAIQNSPNAGYEIFEANASIGARLSLAIARLECCARLLTSEGGALATGQVTFARPTFAAGAINLMPGTTVSTTDGRRFVTLQTAAFGPTDLGPHTVNIQAIAVGFEYNVPGTVTTPSGIVLPGDINSIVTLVTDPAALDPSIVVTQANATNGGQDACLDAIGNDYLIPRAAGESDATYRLRILTTRDVVSPNAITRGLDSLVGVGKYQFLEVGTPELPGIFYDAGSSQNSPQIPANNYAYDMDGTSRGGADQWKLYFSFRDFRGYFLVILPTVLTREFGFSYDGTDSDAYLLQNAYDTVSSSAFGGAYDGTEVQNTSYYEGIYHMLTSKKAGGVGFDLFLSDNLPG